MKPQNYPTQPAPLWEHFYRITQIPRPSKQEAAVRQYVIDEAERAGHSWQADSQGNLVVRVSASPGKEDRETVIIQNHLDMVTVKTGDKQHDFEHDPLELRVEEGWLRADRTTLGADNGVGCAAALALMTSTGLSHPPLELLFTVDEETGLGGALNLDPSLLTGTRMLNLDTEDWNELYVGCAGGGGWDFRRSFTPVVPPADSEHWLLSLAGLAGGHSGIQIHQQLGNAIKLLGQFLTDAGPVWLSSLDAGTAHNVIPREGRAVFSCPGDDGNRLQQLVAGLTDQWRSFLPPADRQLGLTLEPAPVEPSVSLGLAETTQVLDLIAAFPHGAAAYNAQQPADLVDLSINLAILRLKAGDLFLQSSFRYFNEQQSRPLQQTVLALARAFELEVTPAAGYPGWQPDFDSGLLAHGMATHERLFGCQPAVKAIHAGLECGILKSKKPDVDILSFGPTIRDAHSPGEKLRIDTVPPFWQLLTALLAEM